MDDDKLVSDRKSPGFWFYTADFERDMMILSLESQGLWIRMMCWMSDNEAHRGFCEAPNGTPLSSGDIANRVGKSARRIKTCLDEMERLGVFSRDDRNCIYCRRMARDTHISRVRREAAKARYETEKRATNGQFAPAKIDFAPAKVPAKSMQKPAVTASVSDSVTTIRAAAAKLDDFVLAEDLEKPLLLPLELRPQTEYPLTLAVIHEHDRSTQVTFVQQLADECARQIVSDPKASQWPMEKQRKALSDAVIARCCREVFATPRKKPPGVALLKHTVPQILIGGKLNYV